MPYASEYMPLGQAAALAVRYHFAEADARESLVRAIENKRLKYRIYPPYPPDDIDVRCGFGVEGPIDYRPRLELRKDVDWAASRAMVFERYPMDFTLRLGGKETPRRVMVEVHSDEWLALVKREREFAGPKDAPEPAAQPSRTRSARAVRQAGVLGRLETRLRELVRQAKAAGMRRTCKELEQIISEEFGPGTRPAVRAFWASPQVPAEWRKTGPRPKQ